MMTNPKIFAYELSDVNIVAQSKLAKLTSFRHEDFCLATYFH